MTEFATVERAGPLSLIQDCGRRGQQHLGVSVSGSADAHAAGWANYLLQNSPRAALLEICLGPFALRFGAATWFALAGADCQWQLDGRPLQNWCSHRAPAGSLLQGGVARSGLRAYVALAGGIDTLPVWGSRATSVGEHLGGIDGRALQNGARLPYSAAGRSRAAQVPAEYVRDYHHSSAGRRDNALCMRLRLAPSGQFEQFDTAARAQLFAGVYRVSPQSDRMGVRFDGPPLAPVPGNLISEAVAPGAVQVPSNGLPIVLMRDCQTIGGYPKLGHIYRVDLDRLAQARPGDTVAFALGTLEESQAELRQQRRFFDGHPWNS